MKSLEAEGLPEKLLIDDKTRQSDAHRQPVKKERLRLFISHKSADRDLAKKFKDRLVILGFRDSEVYLAEEIQPGDSWHDDIMKALRESHALIFLYTDPSHDWDWCLFECGFFAGSKTEPANLLS
ncbi:MAG TPA: toll/interleukin-1 receptor domain-containing protein, partial [Tepidisphaeraceae bacterium]|nr:toll/interleukin-1 receptor domain-containing protein [Tepidisphaeraceae bacterium]